MPFLQNTGMYRFLYLTFTCQKAVINFEVTITSKQHTLHKYRIASYKIHNHISYVNGLHCVIIMMYFHLTA